MSSWVWPALTFWRSLIELAIVPIDTTISLPIDQQFPLGELTVTVGPTTLDAHITGSTGPIEIVLLDIPAEIETPRFVLRHPPADTVSERAAAGISREFAATSALAGHAPVPDPVANPKGEIPAGVKCAVQF